jgi:hypothetical protein
MAKADDYRRCIESCTIRAELAQTADVREIWLHIRDSYEHLLYLENNILRDLTVDLQLPRMRQG